MVIPTFPRSNYRGIFTTGESYCPLYTLYNGDDYENNIIPDGGIGNVTGGGFEDQAPTLEEEIAPEKMGDDNLVTDALEA